MVFFWVPMVGPSKLTKLSQLGDGSRILKPWIIPKDRPFIVWSLDSQGINIEIQIMSVSVATPMSKTSGKSAPKKTETSLHSWGCTKNKGNSWPRNFMMSALLYLWAPPGNRAYINSAETSRTIKTKHSFCGEKLQTSSINPFQPPAAWKTCESFKGEKAGF